MQRWQDAGADRLYLQVLDLADLDHLDVIAAAIAHLTDCPRHVTSPPEFDRSYGRCAIHGSTACVV